MHKASALVLQLALSCAVPLTSAQLDHPSSLMFIFVSGKDHCVAICHLDVPSSYPSHFAYAQDVKSVAFHLPHYLGHLSSCVHPTHIVDFGVANDLVGCWASCKLSPSGIMVCPPVPPSMATALLLLIRLPGIVAPVL